MGADQVPIKLAQVPAFRLGEVEVDPPSRRISRGDKIEILEPRVMQVLVVLAEARGAVISRDELIERCWGGRIVGENAINRVISRLRQAASELGLDSFQLETITKVGYRMVVIGQAEPVVVAAREESLPPWPETNRDPPPAAVAEPPEADEPLAHSTFSRRSVAAGGVAASRRWGSVRSEHGFGRQRGDTGRTRRRWNSIAAVRSRNAKAWPRKRVRLCHSWNKRLRSTLFCRCMGRRHRAR